MFSLTLFFNVKTLYPQLVSPRASNSPDVEGLERPLRGYNTLVSARAICESVHVFSGSAVIFQLDDRTSDILFGHLSLCRLRFVV